MEGLWVPETNLESEGRCEVQVSNTVSAAFRVFRAVVYACCFLWGFAWIVLRVRTLDPDLGVSLPRGGVIPGLLLMAVGGVLGLTCIVLFVSRGRGTPAPFDAPREFVAIGPYRYVRNPMYVGGLLLLAGLGLYFRSPSVLILSVVIFLLVHLLVVLYEEPTLRAKFGAPYENYCERVRRWIPTWPAR